MINLKPCPFCGGNDIVYEEALSVTYCNDCGGELDEGFGSDWNTRPIEDALTARIAELEAYIDQLIEIGGWAITGMTIATSYSPGVLQNIAERKSDDWYALIKNLKECDKEKGRER